MLFFRTSIIASVVSLACFSAFSKDATICRSPTTGAIQANGAATLTDKTAFICDNGMKGNIRDFYKLGWRVIHLGEMDEDTRNATKFTMILIEKD